MLTVQCRPLKQCTLVKALTKLIKLTERKLIIIHKDQSACFSHNCFSTIQWQQCNRAMQRSFPETKSVILCQLSQCFRLTMMIPLYHSSSTVVVSQDACSILVRTPASCCLPYFNNEGEFFSKLVAFQHVRRWTKYNVYILNKLSATTVSIILMWFLIKTLIFKYMG